jgi:hypothetical protein
VRFDTLKEISLLPAEHSIPPLYGLANKRRISCYAFFHAMQCHVLRFAALHGPLGGGTSGFSHGSGGGGSRADAGPDFFLSDFGNDVKVEVICTIEHSLPLAVVNCQQTHRSSRENVGGYHARFSPTKWTLN